MNTSSMENALTLHSADILSVTENGNLIPCFYTDLRPSEPMMLGNIRDKALTKAWKEVQESKYYSSFKDRNVLKGKCGVCEYRELCGGCRNRAYALIWRHLRVRHGMCIRT